MRLKIQVTFVVLTLRFHIFLCGIVTWFSASITNFSLKEQYLSILGAGGKFCERLFVEDNVYSKNFSFLPGVMPSASNVRCFPSLLFNIALLSLFFLLLRLTFCG